MRSALCQDGQPQLQCDMLHDGRNRLLHWTSSNEYAGSSQLKSIWVLFADIDLSAQLLSAHLQEADPAVFDIIEKVYRPPLRHLRLDYMRGHWICSKQYSAADE